MNLSETSQKFLELLASKLKALGATPVVLRNYQSLPNEIGNDLDIFIEREFLRDGARLLLKLVKECGGELGHVHERDYFHALWFRFEDEEKFWHVDLYPGALTWHGLEILDQERFLDGARPVNPWLAPRAAHEAYLVLLTGVLWGGKLKEEYVGVIDSLLTDSEEVMEFKACFECAFGKVGLGIATEVLEGRIKSDSPGKWAPKLRAALKWTSVKSGLWKSARAWLRHWRGEMRAYFVVPPGIRWVSPEPLNDGMESSAALPEVKCFFGGVVVFAEPQNRLLSKVGQRLRVLKSLGQNRLVVLSGNVESLDGRDVPPDLLDPKKSMGEMAKVLHCKMKEDGYDVDREV